MASVDGAKSLQRGSDEMLENICGPCKQDNVENGANHYCIECGEYLCGPCKDYHRKLLVIKNHKIVSGSEITTANNANQGFGLAIYCHCHNNQEVEFYCEDHDDIVCNPCKIVKHYKCETVCIEKKSKSYTAAKLDSVLSETKSIKDNFDQLKQVTAKAVKDLKHSKEACRKEIKTFREDLDKFLEKLEHELLNDLDERVKKYQNQLDHKISTLNSVIQMLDTDYKLLENAKRDGRKTTMLKSDVYVSKSLNDCMKRLAELEQDIRNPTLSFEKNKNLEDVQSEIKMLGFLKEELHDKHVLLDPKVLVQSSSQDFIDDDDAVDESTGQQEDREENDCIICLDTITEPKKLKCGHVFCTACIDTYFHISKTACPSCGVVCGIIRGDQPNGRMDVQVDGKLHCAGYEGAGCIVIKYSFNSGTQGPDHPNPGKLYRGITRTAYLPNTKEGREVLKMLEVAFDRKLVFTISSSRTTGREGVITWNDIHHKTNPKPNSTFGYPDPYYFDRIKDELAVKGVIPEDIPASYRTS